MRVVIRKWQKEKENCEKLAEENFLSEKKAILNSNYSFMGLCICDFIVMRLKKNPESIEIRRMEYVLSFI